MAIFQYQVYHPVTRARLGRLDIREATWTEAVNGGSTFTGKVTVPESSLLTQSIATLTQPYEAALYAVSDSVISFGGPIVNREWDSDTNTLSLTAMDWKSWTYNIIIGPAADGSSTLTQTYTGAELLTIAQDVIFRMAAEGNESGIPYVDVGWFSSGITRDYIVSGTEFRSVGQWLDDIGGMANNGYEWEIEPYWASDGLPKSKFQFYVPQRGGAIAGLAFRKTPEGGNILKIDDLEEDATGVARRIWAVGEGPNAESTPWGADSDPALEQRYALRTDKVANYTGSLTPSMLARYARAEREYRAQVLGGLSFTVSLDAPDWTTYGKGDRCRIVVRDRFMNVNVSNCRILSRQIIPDSNTAKLTVNLSDTVVREIDIGGVV